MSLAGPEWWQRLGVALGAWAAGHPVLVRRLRLARAVGLWASLAWLLVLYALMPEVRESLRVYAQLYWVLIAWFLLARMKTVSWRLLSGVFALGVPWSLAVGWICTAIAESTTYRPLQHLEWDGFVTMTGAMIGVASIGEETLKLVPLAVLALAAPGRVRRFAVVDWLLVGLASGLAFQAVEELARRVGAAVIPPGLGDVLRGYGPDERGPHTHYAQYGFSPLSGGSSLDGIAGFPGHHVTTALAAAAIGAGIAAWRHANRSSQRARLAWRVAGLAVPLLAWWTAVAVHAGLNATASNANWAQEEHSTIPAIVEWSWRLANHGYGHGWLLLAALLAVLLVDAHHQHTACLPALAAGKEATPLRPWARTEAWTARLAAGLTGAAAALKPLVRAGCALAAYTLRDLAVIAAGHTRDDGEPRRAVLARGRAGMALAAELRAAAIARHHGPDTTASRRAHRLVAIGALALAALAVWWLAPALAEAIGNRTTDPSAGWLAGTLEALADWWEGLSPGAKIGIGFGIAALIALSGGSLGLAFGISGAATFVLDHSRTGAALARDPRGTIRDYLANTTPQGMAADAAQALFAFALTNGAGALLGRGLNLATRRAIDTYRHDPAAFRRFLTDTDWRDDTGAIDLSAFVGADRIKWTPAARQRWVDGRLADPNPDMARPANLNHPGDHAFQTTHAGPTEALIVTSDGEVSIWADGLTVDPDKIVAVEAKYVRNPGSGLYEGKAPAPLSEKMLASFDGEMERYAAVIADQQNPIGRLRIVTSTPEAATFLGDRARRILGPTIDLDITIRPGG